MKKLNQVGFSAVEGLLIIVIVGILGFTGFYIYNAQRNTNATLDNSTKTTTQQQSASRTNADASLAAFTAKDKTFSVLYPKDWVMPANPKWCGDYLNNSLEIGPDSGAVIKCGGDGTVSQVSISSASATDPNAQDSQSAFLSTGYKDQQASGVTSNGVKGMQYKAVASGQQNGQGLGGLPDGSIVIKDVFIKGKTVSIAEYKQYPATSKEGPTQDETKTFQAIVSSLKF